MFSRYECRLIVLGIVLIFAAIDSHAQQTVYQWTDEDGVVHFSDAPPDGAVEVTTITTAPPPTNVPAEAAPVQTPAAATTDAKEQAAPAEPEAPPPVKTVDITKLSLAELDQRCNDAREIKIAPLREAEIETCKQDKREDPAFCERFNADFGDGGRTVSGSIRPRMFDDLPECVDALQERNRRPR